MISGHATTTVKAEKTPGVAVVMRTKDRPVLLHRALSSVLSQRYPEWHLYLVNDGGDKNVLEEMLAAYRPSFKDKLTVIHHEQSKGMEAASNAALSLVKQEFASIHDDDDSWDPEFLLHCVQYLSNSRHQNFVAVYTDYYVIQERIQGNTVKLVEKQDNQAFGKGIIDYAKLLHTNCFPPISMMFRFGAVEKIGGYNAAMPVLGDWDFNIRLMSVGDIGYIDLKLANYHHRIKGTNSGYSNTVVDGTNIHQFQNTIYRNNYLREIFRANPEFIGLLQPILHQIQEQNLHLIRLLEHQMLVYREQSRSGLIERQPQPGKFKKFWQGIRPLRRKVQGLFGHKDRKKL